MQSHILDRTTARIRFGLDHDPLADPIIIEAPIETAEIPSEEPVRNPDLYIEEVPLDSYDLQELPRLVVDQTPEISSSPAEIEAQGTDLVEILTINDSPTADPASGHEPIPAIVEDQFPTAEFGPTADLPAAIGESEAAQVLIAEALPVNPTSIEEHADPDELHRSALIRPPKKAKKAVPKQDDLQAISVDSIDELPTFKGVVARVVNEKNQKEVAVLDVGCANVVIVCTEKFLASPMHLGLVSNLKGPRFQLNVESEYLASESLISEIRHISERRSQQQLIPVISADNKHIVLYDEIVQRAVALKATDIHFEITDSDLSSIRLRIYGRLHYWRSFPTDLLKGALSAAYSKRTKSGTNSAGALSLERAMNTMTEQVVNGKSYNGRFNGYPLVNGYDVVMRLLESDPRSVVPTVEALGYAKNHIEDQILPAIRKNAGMIAIAGSTGSGKSTALRSFIYSIPDRDKLKIFGVEDPTEYLNPFMRQISVQRNSDDEEHVVKMKFLSALRSVLRMDPDVLMLGEIRDKDSASLASEFNRTGHRVFTTVHGDGCVDVLARLASEEIGIHPSTLAAKKYLSAVMYQKLLPILCEHCRVPAVNALGEREQSLLKSKFGLDPTTMYCSSEVGCEHCKMDGVDGGGTKGLTVVAEILTPTDEILELIREKDWLGVEKAWRWQRRTAFNDPDMAGKTAYEHALYKASIGLVDPRDIEVDFESFAGYRILQVESDISV